MLCPICHHEHPDDARFCPETGQRIELPANRCPQCGNTDLPPAAKFCPRCGTPIKPTSLAYKKSFLMPIEDVFYLNGRGTIVTGRIEKGVIKIADNVHIIGYGEFKKASVVGIEQFGKILEEAKANDNVGLLLCGVEKKELKRGMVIAHPGVITPHKKFKASIYMLRIEEGGRHTPFGNKFRPQFYIRTMVCYGEIHLSEGTSTVKPGDNVEIIIELDYSAAVNVGLRFAFREDGHPIGAGIITHILD